MQLTDWLTQKSMTRKDFAAEIGVVPSYITALCAGELWPSRRVLEQIQRVTDGAVTANDFLSDGAAA